MRLIILACLWVLLIAHQGWCLEITGIDFNGAGNSSAITIQGDGPLQFEKQENPDDKQIILEFKGASISKSNSRKIDTSSFNSKVVLISPYQVEGQETVRVVIQLRDFVSSEISPAGNLVTLKIPNGPALKTDQSAESSAGDSSLESSSPPPVAPSKPKSNLDEFIENHSNKNFSGKLITLQLKDADLTDVFRMIGDASGFNVILGDDVKGKISLSLVDVPWDQALDVVLHTAHLGAERNNNVLRVATLTGLTQEKLDELRAKDATKAVTPQVTKVFFINYANVKELQGVLSQFSSQANSSLATNSTGGGSSPSGMPGSGFPGMAGTGSPSSSVSSMVQIDNRTNSIIVRDFPENIEKMKKLVEILDTQTPQVMIEAKIVEANENFANDVNGGLGFGSQAGTQYYASFNQGNPLDPLVSPPTPGAGIASGSAGSGVFGFSPDVSFIPGVDKLNAILNLAEGENQAKTITSPKTVVLNKQKASILESQPVLVPAASTTTTSGTVVAGVQVQDANISLEVTPTVTNDGSIQLDLSVSRDEPVALPSNQQGVGKRTLKTLVLVESGSTLVIGGVYVLSKTHVDEGIPFLRKIPILGALFGHTSDSLRRNELFIFITPRVINMKEAGLKS